MAPFFPNAGAGPKITMKFKAKIFSFADVVVNNNSLTLLQISEPLQSTSSASPSNPYPYGADFFGAAINDPARCLMQQQGRLSAARRIAPRRCWTRSL
jgi:hypothetical protein